MSSTMQPVSMLMSNLNVESAARHSPSALAAAQDTGQSQEIIREGIRAVQTVQESDKAAQAQRVHRKDSGDEEEQGRRNRQGKSSKDSFEHTETKQEDNAVNAENAPLIRETVRSRKSFEFLA